MRKVIFTCCSLFAGLALFAQDPAISVDPGSLMDTLYTGGITSREISVTNNGTALLTGIVKAEPTFPTGSINHAVQLDGVNDYGRAYNDETLQLTANFTIETWINFEEGGLGTPVIVSKGRDNPDFEVFLDTNLSSTSIGLSLNLIGTIISESLLSAGQWYHVAFTYDGQFIKLYIDGTLDKSQVAMGLPSTSNLYLYLGKRDNSTQHRYKGSIDDLRIWNRVKSQEEIIQEMNHELTGQESGLAAYWKFNEESGNMAYDGSLNNNYMTLLGGIIRIQSQALIINWLKVLPPSISILSGQSAMLDVGIDAAGLDGGYYGGQVIILSNDPDNPEVNIPVELTVIPTALINVSVTQLNFGEVFVGASEEMAFVVSNSGNDTLQVSSITCTNTDYAISPAELIVIPGQSDSVFVTYMPSQAGNDNAPLTLTSNDHITPVISIMLTGMGVSPPIIGVAPSQLDTVLFSGNTAMESFTISNSGESDLEWEIDLENIGFPSVTFTKANYADWTDPANQDRITPNVFLTRANSEGLFNIKTESSYNYNISPENTEWAYGYTEALEPGDYEVWRNAVGGYPPGMVNNPISLHLINEDLYFDVLFHSWSSGNSGGGFSYTRTSTSPPWLQLNEYSGVLAPGTSVEIMVTYDASGLEGGNYEGNIAISSNDPISPLVNLPAYLEVIDAPSIGSNIDTLDFGTLYIGYDNSRTLPLSIFNNGSLDLIIFDASADPEEFTVSPSYAGIDPGEFESFNVTFTPGVIGDYTGSLTFTSNDPVEDEYTVVLIGQLLVPPEITVDPETLSATLYSGKTTTQTLTISNSGGSDLDFVIADYSLKLDGYGDYVTVSNPDLYDLDQFTLEAWIKMDEYRTGGIITLGDAGSERFSLHVGYYYYGMYLEYSQDWNYYYNTLSYYYIYPGSWIHVAVTHNGSTVRLYLNGAMVNSTQMSSPMNFNSAFNLYFGNQIGGTPEYFKGMMDDIRIWDYSRSETEILETMESNLTGQETGLIGCWKFDEIAGSVARDASINTNHGILQGNAGWEDNSSLPGWLLINPAFGTCNQGTSMNIDVIFDASFLSGGDYSTDIIISSNDPTDPSIAIPVTLHVIDAPSLYTNQDTLDFGNVYLGYSEQLDLEVVNNGSLDLLIFSAEATPEEYTVFPPYASLDPGDTESFHITFSPEAVGEYPGILTLTCNDPVLGEYLLTLTGKCIEPPVFSVTPDSISVEIPFGQTLSESLEIFNSGGSDLNFIVTPGEGSMNHALQFDGMNDQIDLGANISLSGMSFTLEVWAKRSASGGDYIFSQGYSTTNRALQVGFRSNNVFTFSFYNNDLNTPIGYTDEEWHHWACTFDASNRSRKIYRDGLEVASGVASSNYTGYGQFLIGSSPWNSDFFEGILDDIRIWNVVRTQDEIEQHMNHKLLGNESGLIGYWDLDEGTGTIVNDKSPYGNHGSLINGTAWTDQISPISPAWLNVIPDEGAVPANSSMELDVVFDAGYLDLGDYFATIFVSTNDPVNPEISVPVHMKIVTTVGTGDIAGSRELSLKCYPNPFSRNTTFSFEIEDPSRVDLVICNSYGELVTELECGIKSTGLHKISWNTEGLPAGIYYCKLLAGNKMAVTKMIVLK